MNTIPKIPFFFVFDCESIGLHGDTFAVGFTVIDPSGREHDSGLYSCCQSSALGSDSDRNWVESNIPDLPITHDSRDEMMDEFWSKWLEWKEKEAVMVTDCGWPVEANFLTECINQQEAMRKWEGPYPLFDLSSILLAHCVDAVAEFDRLPSELPAHNPLNDARQSARILIQHL